MFAPYWYYQNQDVDAAVSNRTLKEMTSLACILHAYPQDDPFNNGIGPDQFLKFVLKPEYKKWFYKSGYCYREPEFEFKDPQEALLQGGEKQAALQAVITKARPINGLTAYPDFVTIKRVQDGTEIMVQVLVAAAREVETCLIPPSGSVKINGTPKAGEALTSEGFLTMTGDFTWEWADSATAADSEWTTITNGLSGENNSILTLDDALVGKYIRVKRGGTASEPVGPIAPADSGGSNPQAPLRAASPFNAVPPAAQLSAAKPDTRDGSYKSYADAGMSKL
jgi:hypothetical protein